MVFYPSKLFHIRGGNIHLSKMRLGFEALRQFRPSYAAWKSRIIFNQVGVIEQPTNFVSLENHPNSTHLPH